MILGKEGGGRGCGSLRWMMVGWKHSILLTAIGH